MYRVTVYAGRKHVAQNTTAISDPGNTRHVENAGRDVCESRGKAFPKVATVVVHRKPSGGRWMKIAEVVCRG